jgi:hypothetical protein
MTEDTPLKEVATHLVHEGTHLTRDLEDSRHGFPDEREAWDNAYKFAKEINYPQKNATDKDLAIIYGFTRLDLKKGTVEIDYAGYPDKDPHDVSE